ncbi:MAG TPA: hypothetical protein VHC49_11370 [Mycobacteriales bacterium]|nr:hypothetical protein [Mycobacteriales bacterium]
MAFELAYRNRDELLLWDTWPGVQDFDDALVDRIAAALLADDSGDESVDTDLADFYDRYGPGGFVTQLSPYGWPPREVALRRRGV